MMARYPLLQSGFLIKSESGVSIPEKKPENLVRPLVQRPPNHTQDDYHYSHGFQQLYKDLINNAGSFNRVEKHREMYELLSVLFTGIQGWAGFVRLQESQSGLSDLHAQFLSETTLFLMGKIPRRVISLPLWASMLSNANKPANKPFKATTYKLGSTGLTFQDVFSDQMSKTFTSTDQSMLHWVQTLGLVDMMTSMYVIFGRRDIHALLGAAE